MERNVKKFFKSFEKNLISKKNGHVEYGLPPQNDNIVNVRSADKNLTTKTNSHPEALAVLKSILPCKIRKAHQQGKQGAQGHNDYAILRSAQNNEKRAAFTKPSRGTNEVRDEHQSTETLSFRCWCERCRLMRGAAFTLAEVLITLGIIGVVAAMTIPTVINKYKEFQYKIAYKKVYSELSNAVSEAITNQEFTRTEGLNHHSTIEEWNVIKTKFKVVKECSKRNTFDCWVNADTIGGSMPDIYSACIIDASGKNWCEYYYRENIFLVDVNGFKSPNQFGKDRWIFTFADKNGVRVDLGSQYAKVIPLENDTLTSSSWCKHPPCYYKSWLYK